MTVLTDFSRQFSLLNPDKFTTPIHVIGCGATGSWVVLMLAKMGLSKNLTVHDFDVVAEHNIPNQAFDLKDIGYNKAEAIYYKQFDHTKHELKVRRDAVTGSTPLEGIVFMLTDTMSSRKEIYEQAIRYKPNVQLLIETRMDLEGGRIYCVNPLDLSQLKKYESTFYSDSEASVSACGTSQSLVATAIQIASMAVWKMLNYHLSRENFFETLVDCSNNLVINS